jgi:hypothetical protein
LAGVEGFAGVTPSFWSREDWPPGFFTELIWLCSGEEKRAGQWWRK